MSENHLPDRTVIEVGGELEVCAGIHQAIKYQSGGRRRRRVPIADLTGEIPGRRLHHRLSRARDLAERYDIALVSVDHDRVLVLNAAR